MKTSSQFLETFFLQNVFEVSLILTEIFLCDTVKKKGMCARNSIMRKACMPTVI